jgi:uncharacterized protein YjgD (DUF1641 family)
VSKQQRGNPLDKRLQALADMSVEIVNHLAERKIDNTTINVADIYFVLSKALQHVSLLNLTEIEDYNKKTKENKFAV